MKAAPLFGFGVALYALLNLARALLAHWHIAGAEARTTEIVVAALTALVFANLLHKRSWADILPYSLAWTFIAIGFDALLAPEILSIALSDWTQLTVYGLILLVPLVATRRPHHV